MHNQNGHIRRQGGAQSPPPTGWAGFTQSTAWTGKAGRRLVLLSAALVLSSMAACNSQWETEHSIDIAASPERVWQLLSELENYGQWNPYSPRAEGRLVVGEEVRIEAHLGDEVRWVNNLVTEVEPGKKLCWHSLEWYGFLARGFRCRNLQPLPDGGVRLVHHELMVGPLSGLIERIYREDIDEGLRVMDEALKAAAETTGQQQ